jgi:HEAT repeat protein
MESLQVLARLGLKDQAISIARTMLGELSAGDDDDHDEKVRLEIAQLLAECGQAREASALLLAWVREPFRIEGALETLAKLGFVEEIASLTREVDVDPNLRFAAAFVLIRFGRLDEGKAILLEFVNPTPEIKNTFELYEEMRWEAAKALSQFPEHRQLGEQVWEEIARTEKYLKHYNIMVRRVAIMKLKENGQVRALLDIGSNQSTPARLRKDIAAALLELGHTRDAEAIARDIGPRLDDGP